MRSEREEMVRDSLGRTRGPGGVWETPEEKRKRVSSLLISILIMFMDGVSYSALLPSVIFHSIFVSLYFFLIFFK